MNKSFRIFIADDHEVVRRGIRSLLEGHAGWEVCGEARDGRDAVIKVAELKPDLVLLDVGMPNLNGRDAARQILNATPGTRILILTVHESEAVIREVLEVGARGFLLKSDAAALDFSGGGAAETLDILYVERGRDGFGGISAPGRRSDQAMKDRLTSREREVVQLLAEGKTSKEVAVVLNLSVKTAETHRTNVMRKLDLHSVADLVRYAVRNRIVQVV